MKKIASFLTALTLMISALPYSPTAGTSAAEEYLIRDKWGYCTTANYAESEHFVIFYGNSDTTGQVNEAFLKRNLEAYERLWNCYGEYLGMENMNVDIYGKSSQKYKTNVYLTYTGLDKYPDGWAFMSAEDGYGIEIISPEAMLDDLTVAHEFGHVVTMQQKAWVDQDITGAWWEPLANWFREMYLCSDYYPGDTKTAWFEPYLRNLSLTLPHGRNYYEVWPFLMYISYNPDDLPGLGINAVKRIISEAKPYEYPFDTITRLFGTDSQTIFGHYAKRMATFDFGEQDAYKDEFSKKLAQSPFYWNLFYTVLKDNGTGWLEVPQEEAPMQAGINIVPLDITGDTITAELRGISDDTNAGWQACIVTVDASGNETYSGLFGSGQKASVSARDAVSAYLTITAMPEKLVKVNAFHKDRDSSCKDGDERRRYPYEIRLSGADVQQSGGYSKGRGHVHSNGGGWVADTASVSDSVYVGPDAMVLGYAKLSGNVRVEDYAVVANSVTAQDNAVISGHAVVDGGGWYYDNGWKQGSITLSGNAVISGSAVVTGACSVSDNAKVLQKAYLEGGAKLTGNAVAKGMAYSYGSPLYSGNTILDGDYANEKSVSGGVNFGWLDDSGSHSISESYVAGYDFSSESRYWAKDSSTCTNARQIDAEWSEERTSAKGVLNFSGGESCLMLDSSILNTKDIQISLGVLWKGGNAKQEILHFGDEKSYLSLTPDNGSGAAELVITDGNDVEKLTASNALIKGEWSKITVRIIDGVGSLLINGREAANKPLKLDMQSVLSASADDSAVVGKEFKGAVDYIRLSNSAVDEPAVAYSGKEEPDDTGRLRGDVNADNLFNIADLVSMQNWLLARPGSSLADWENGDLVTDGILNVFDVIMMRRDLFSLK